MASGWRSPRAGSRPRLISSSVALGATPSTSYASRAISGRCSTGELLSELARRVRHRGLRLAIVHPRRAQNSDGTDRLSSPSTRYGARTSEHSRRSASSFSEPMRTVRPRPGARATAFPRTTCCSKSSSSPDAPCAWDASCSAAEPARPADVERLLVTEPNVRGERLARSGSERIGAVTRRRDILEGRELGEAAPRKRPR